MPQALFDIYQNAGLGQLPQRKVVQYNPELYASVTGPQDYGLSGWTVDTADVTSVTQAIVSGTAYFTHISLGFSLSLVKLGLLLGTTGPVTAGTYSGFALFSSNGTTLTKLADTGATDSAKWVTAGASGYVEDSLSSPQGIIPGSYYLAFIAAFTTMPTVVSAPAPNIVNAFTIRGTTVKRSLSVAAQTSFAATYTIGSMTAGTFTPLVGFASS